MFILETFPKGFRFFVLLFSSSSFLIVPLCNSCLCTKYLLNFLMWKWNHLFGLVSFNNILRTFIHLVACRRGLKFFIIIYILQQWITFSGLMFVLLWALLPCGENEDVIYIYFKIFFSFILIYENLIFIYSLSVLIYLVSIF